ncbi:3-galactosyl-N-acetylglucosaminide 4-alpha-L-fucosyltransferase FUT3-like [Engystomops pustulosus]|uniref:3-galactosyl-N-acetylglucosaminide 4-alpha-L-fucosyltransferase FUT3-like n=1 Tax=Engystomops pustulosus TaxID=76066 RepID=UPI003AFB4742
MIKKTKILIFILIILLVVGVVFYWGQFDVSSQASETQETKISPLHKEDEIVVLVWLWPFGDHFPLNTCLVEFGISGCHLTVDRNLYEVANAVVIHHVDIMYDKKSLPQQPRPHFQHWVWFNMEPPLIIKNLDLLDDLFNRTMTFRQDSDIFRPYGQLVPSKGSQNYTIPTKSKLVSWVVSKWYPGVRRTEYYEELKKYVHVDVYGGKHQKLSSDDFHSTISQYKFYLAFENSIFKDYITEKLWSNAFGSWAVPVVLGTSRKNYERFVPGDAFIHVDDFSSPMELASYLLELDKNDEKYRKYFNWRSHYEIKVGGGWQLNYCKVCESLSNGPHYQVIPSISKWFLNNSAYFS